MLNPAKDSRFIIATHHRFWKLSHGGDARIFALVDFLIFHNVDVVIFFLGSCSDEDNDVFNGRFPKSSLIAFAGTLVLPALDSKHHGTGSLSDFECQRTRTEFNNLVAEFEPSTIIVEQIYLSFLLSDILKWKSRPILCLDTIDIIHERYERMVAATITPDYQVSREQEIDILENATPEMLGSIICCITTPTRGRSFSGETACLAAYESALPEFAPANWQ